MRSHRNCGTDGRRRAILIGAVLMLMATFVVARAPEAAAAAENRGSRQPAAEAGVLDAQEVRTVWTSEFGVADPAGLAYDAEHDEFLVARDDVRRTFVVRLSTDEERLGSLELPQLDDPETLAYDESEGDLTAIDGDQLLAVDGDDLTRSSPSVDREPIAALDFDAPDGATFDPQTGDWFVLEDATVSVVDDGTGARAGAETTGTIELSADTADPVIAYNSADELLYVMDAQSETLEGLDSDGNVRTRVSLASTELSDPVAMTFAPTTDPTDDADELNLFVADSGTATTSGGVTELSFATVAALAAPVDSATHVRTTQTSGWNPASPDPAGIVWLPTDDDLVVVDSEVDETTGAGWNNVNLWQSTRTGTVTHVGTMWGTGSAGSFSKEPTGLSHDVGTDRLFVSDDSAGAVFVVRPGPDGDFGTADDVVSSVNTETLGSTDTEDPEYDPASGDLFVLDGVGREIYRIDPVDGVFGNGNDSSSHFDISHLGPSDFEGLAADGERGTLYVGARTTEEIFEITHDGTLVRTIQVPTSSGITYISGLGVAPSSTGSGAMHFYVVDRAVDNGANSNENDGRIFEFAAPNIGGGTVPEPNDAPTVSAGPDQSITLPTDSVNLDGTVSDDGMPDPPGALTTSWSEVSGPGTVTFGNASAVDTTATFPATGSYVLRLTASDGQKTASDELTVTVAGAGGEVTVERRVGARFDDAEEDIDGSISVDSSDLELVTDGGGEQTVGMRFTDVTVPNGATILSASVQFQVDETTSVATSLTIRGQDTDSASEFSTAANSISSRPTTAASASWSPPAWTTVGAAGADQRTPDMSAVIQEVVDRPGWTSGNPLAVIVTGTGERVAEAFNGDAAGAPLLRVEYTTDGGPPPAVNVAPVVSAGPDRSVTLPASASLDGSVSDDGLPVPPGAVTTLWSKVSGPGTVSFGDASAVD
ncbi:MAG TPA: hypothetical protein VFZ70_15345, partial [Euzebyales bacterium]